MFISFPTKDFRGFWISYSAEDSAPNDIKFSLVSFISGYGQFFSFDSRTNTAQ